MKENTVKCPNCKEVFKVDDLTIKKLTYENFTMKEKFNNPFKNKTWLITQRLKRHIKLLFDVKKGLLVFSQTIN
ncbi:MAG: hypothetical protein P8H93_04260 [Polaribacter sp.]|nr:hypothetical protein [Polaribacter sp.]